MNPKGGIDPVNHKAEERAEKADLITLPENVVGTNCFNCKFVSIVGKDLGMCIHPKVLQPVTGRMCCKFWDAKGSLRPWKK